MEKDHSSDSHCTCHLPGRLSQKGLHDHISLAHDSRREFLRKGFGVIGTSLLSPLSASALLAEDGAARNREIMRNKAIQDGKATVVSLLHTADIHAQLLTHDEFFVENGKAVYRKRGGLATLKSMVNVLRRQNPERSMLIDGGDCFQGGGVAALTKGQAIVPLMNNIGYDLMLPGNWEVVYGKEMMMRDLFGYTANKTCANMFHDTKDASNGELIFPPYQVRHFGNIKIGFIGYNDPLTPIRQSPAYSEGIRFAKPEENLERYVRLLREYEKCNLVILVTHLGLTQQVALANTPYAKGVDYILGADTHERIRTPIQGVHARVTEPGAFGSFVGKLDFVVEKGELKEQSYQLLDVDPEVYPEDPEMKKLIEEARSPFRAELDKVIGVTKTPLLRYYVMETPMDNFITDAIMWKYSPDVALSNGFRFCPPLVPGHSGTAEITADYLWSMLPVDSEAKQGIVSGQQLWTWLEKELTNAFAKDPAKRFGGWVVRFKGMEVNITVNADDGKRINWIKIKGQPIDLKRSYTFVACEREGDPDTTLCRVNNIGSPKKLGATLHSVIREYLAQFSPISPALEGRITATDAPEDLLTQLSGYGYEFR